MAAAKKKVPELLTTESHAHPGARAIVNHTVKDLQCAFCGLKVADVRVSDRLVDPDSLGLLDALGDRVSPTWLETVARRVAKLGKHAAAAEVSSVWDNESLASRTPRRLEVWEDPRPAVQDAAVIALSGGPHGFGTPDTLFDRVSHADKRRTIALYDRDARAIAEGTLTTADRSWRVGRLGDVGRMVEPYRAVVGTSPA